MYMKLLFVHRASLCGKNVHSQKDRNHYHHPEIMVVVRISLTLSINRVRKQN